jgi:hypothetical protein
LLTTLAEESTISAYATRDELETRTRNRNAIHDDLSFRAPAIYGETWYLSLRTWRLRTRAGMRSSSALAGTTTVR